ncbi:hypothetical protein B0I35DRAFT_91164 [Stachybotrys elegans]|uniref:Uncharacterized protein n=1 Tax=Stachybotrys elegans TaxID=80388 RepID=A0A8K0SG98_9HYPO|nr:hypothetical protein B0I35DRAFT_91164 [Stachybotrys elegans]
MSVPHQHVPMGWCVSLMALLSLRVMRLCGCCGRENKVTGQGCWACLLGCTRPGYNERYVHLARAEPRVAITYLPPPPRLLEFEPATPHQTHLRPRLGETAAAAVAAVVAAAAPAQGLAEVPAQLQAHPCPTDGLAPALSAVLADELAGVAQWMCAPGQASCLCSSMQERMGPRRGLPSRESCTTIHRRWGKAV